MEELEVLLTEAQNGDLDAFGEIVRRFQDMAVGYASAILGDVHLAEDVAQEAFTEAYLNLSSVYSAYAFPGWLRKIVFKFCDRLTRRKLGRFVSLDTAGELRSQDRGPAEILEAKDARELVQASLRSLPEGERTVVNLFYINEFSQREVAAFLDLPVTTVNFRLHSARKQLKKEFFNMARQSMKAQRPSKDEQFTGKVQSRVQSVQKLHEGLLPELESLFTKNLGREIKVELSEAHEWMFGFYTQSLGKFCCDYCFTVEPLEGRVFLDLSLRLCVAVLEPDADDEGIGRTVESRLATPIGETWLTQGEIETLNRSAKGIIEALEAAWRPVREITIANIELETVPTFVGNPFVGTPAIHLVMKVKSPGRQDLELYLCYLVSTLEPALAELG